MALRDGAVESGLEDTAARFSTTSWTLVDALRDPSHPHYADAQAVLIKRYWSPVYAWVRRQPCERERAAEITQGFFVDRVVGQRLFEQATAQRGTLRGYMLAALNNYMKDRARREKARGGRRTVPLGNFDVEEKFLDHESGGDPAYVFDRRWAVAMLEEALRRTQRYLYDTGLGRHWEAFEAYAVRPAANGAKPPALAALGRDLGFDSGVATASALKVVRKHARLFLREVVAETACDAAGREEEYLRLKELLGGG